jgi:hypothetical protein
MVQADIEVGGMASAVPSYGTSSYSTAEQRGASHAVRRALPGVVVVCIMAVCAITISMVTGQDLKTQELQVILRIASIAR